LIAIKKSLHELQTTFQTEENLESAIIRFGLKNSILCPSTVGLIPWENSRELYGGTVLGYYSASRQDIITVKGLSTLNMK